MLGPVERFAPSLLYLLYKTEKEGSNRKEK
jgi:hypothetical protein